MAQRAMRGWALGWVLAAMLAGCGGGGSSSTSASADAGAAAIPAATPPTPSGPAPVPSDPAPTPAAPVAATYPVGGVVTGLAGEVTLRDTSGQELGVRANGNFQWAAQVPEGTPYAISVARHPVGQTCTASNNVGRVTGAVNDIRVACVTNNYPVTIDVRGASAELVIGSSLGDTLTVRTSGSVTLPTPVAYGQAYTLTVQSPGQVCAFDQAGDTAQGQPLQAVLQCSAQTWTLGGTIQGLAGSLVLRNSDGSEVSASANGNFTFPRPLPNGSSYAVIVAVQPGGQQCTVANGSGTLAGNVGNVAVRCDNVTPPPPPVPGAPANFRLSYGARSFTFQWDAVPGATRYEVYQDVDASGPAPMAAVGTGITTTSFTLPIDVILHQRIISLYGVRACNANGCGAGSALITPDVTQAVGYFKASNTGAGDLFGYSVALSSDGNTMAVGSWGEDSYANGVDGDQANDGARDSGAVYIFVRTGGVWTQQAYVKETTTRADDHFGAALALTPDGNKLAVGAPTADASKGRVFIYERAGNAWAGTNAPGVPGEAGDQFGWSVAFSADGTTLVVGAPGEASASTGTMGNPYDNTLHSAGAVYVFTHPTPTTWQPQAYLKASLSQPSRFGTSLALTPDGNLLAVGAPQEGGVGSAYVFSRTGSQWSRTTTVQASDPAAGAQYGTSVALSADGSVMVVGAPYDNHASTGINPTWMGTAGSGTAANAGAAYILHRFPTTGYTEVAMLKENVDIAGDRFGTSVSLSADGNMLAVGAPLESSSAIGFGGTQSQDTTQAGAVFLYGRDATTRAWSLVVYVKPTNTQPNVFNNSWFGQSVAISGDGSAMAVGAPGENGASTGIQGDQQQRGAASAGAVYLY